MMGNAAGNISSRVQVLTYKFNGDLLVVQQVGPLENHTKRTLADFLADTVVNTDDIGG
jgi:hypothetical protein